MYNIGWLTNIHTTSLIVSQAFTFLECLYSIIIDTTTDGKVGTVELLLGKEEECMTVFLRAMSCSLSVKKC
jgi:hypothetical protein